MPTRILETEHDRGVAIMFMRAVKLPVTWRVTKGKDRSLEQNRLSHKWYSEIAEQLEDDTPEAYRAYCKLRFGVPILRHENEKFREAYDRLIKPRPYEEKLELMAEPLDFPVSRLMTTKQMTQYLDAIYHHFTTECGVQLTEPEER